MIIRIYWKYCLCLIAQVFLGLCCGPAFGQEEFNPYRIEGDVVIFEFDIRAYEKAISEDTGEEIDFAELKVNEVALSGDFNRWSGKGWTMEKTGEYTYQLSKKLSAFNDNFNWEFKYLINGQYFAEPSKAFFPGKTYRNSFIEEVYNLKLHAIEPDPDGNVHFFLKGRKKADKVILTGTFIGWDEQHLRMEPVEDGWQLRINLLPGRYEYKFIVDGDWTHDHGNPNAITNEHGTLNSVLFVNRDVLFQLKGFEDARAVYLAGSFNNWNPREVLMEKTESGWQKSMPLVGGKHLYKFIVDGNWIVDPANPAREKDREGYVNSVLIVR